MYLRAGMGQQEVVEMLVSLREVLEGQTVARKLEQN
jgi:hypothetical protein